MNLNCTQFNKKYPWLGITTTLEKYIYPDYYDKILKPYVFNGKQDLDFLKESATQAKAPAKILELGPGSGRATQAVLEVVKNIERLTLVDLSGRMLEKCKAKFADKNFITYVNSDTMDFLLSAKESYDFIFSLWSFSHSVHQNLKKLGWEKGTQKIRRAISKMLIENLEREGSFFLIHFDSLSPEQRISIKQRKKDNFVFFDASKQSPSKLLIDELFGGLEKDGAISLTSTHYVGAPLEFYSLEQALEYYLNFHMESHFNQSKLIDDMLSELSSDIEKYRDKDGVIRITPGCFMYTVNKK